MNIKGRWIHKTVDNYNFFLFFLCFFFNGNKRLLRLLITVSYWAVTEIKLQSCSVLRKEREWKGEEEKKEREREMPVEKEEQWHSWIFIASHICSRLAFHLFFFAVQHGQEVLTKEGDCAVLSGSRFNLYRAYGWTFFFSNFQRFPFFKNCECL